MTSVKITDAAVDRAKRAYNTSVGQPGTTISAPCVREMLEAALTEPPPEEIPVSANMRDIGGQIINPAINCASYSDWGRAYAEQAYRAMERVRREEQRKDGGQGAAPCGASVPDGSVVIKDRRVKNKRRGRGYLSEGFTRWCEVVAKDRRRAWCWGRRKDDDR